MHGIFLLLLISPAHRNEQIPQSMETKKLISFVPPTSPPKYSCSSSLETLFCEAAGRGIQPRVRCGALVEMSPHCCKGSAVNATKLTTGNVAYSLVCISHLWRPRQDKCAYCYGLRCLAVCDNTPSVSAQTGVEWCSCGRRRKLRQNVSRWDAWLGGLTL